MKKWYVLVLPLLVIFVLGCESIEDSTVVSRDDQPDVFMVEDENLAMNLAMEEARDTIDVFIDALISGAYYSVSLKGRFEDGAYIEHMWIENISYENQVFLGTLANEPLDLKNIAYGDNVELEVDHVSDWMIVDEDGKVTGGYTIKVLRNTMSEEDRAEFDESTGLFFDE